MFDALRSKWKDAILHLFDIRVGEFRRVWLMQLHVFLLIQSLWIVKPVVNAQFLSRVGIDKLPLVFLLVALAALFASTAYSRLLNRLALATIMIRTYLISILCLLSFALLLHYNLFQDWMSYIFYIGVALFGLITTSQFWLLGNLVFSSLEAKRLFGFIGAGAIAGGISGGYVTSVLAPLMDSTNLLFVASGLLVVSMGINRKIQSEFASVFDLSAQIKQTKTLHEYPLRLIRNSRHLTYLALIMGISVVVAKLVEFQFSALASSRIQDPDRLSAFFGFWFSTSNLVSLAIQLFVTQRLIAWLGVGRSLFVLPGALFAGAAFVLYAPVLWASTALKLFDISLKQSINKAATELLILPIPLAIKNQTKSFIDVFVDTTATGIGGIVLIFLINGLNFSVRAVCLMILALIFLWIYFALRVRKEYALAFQINLGIPRQESTKKSILLSDSNIAKEIRRILQTGSIEQIVFLVDRIEESKDQGLMQDVIPLLTHESTQVRQAALRCLYYHKDHSVTKQIEPLLNDPDDEVRSRAFSSMLAHIRQNRVQFINASLKDKDPAISDAALIGLATEARNNPEMLQLFNLEERIHEKIKSLPHLKDPKEAEASKITVLKAIGYGKLSTFYPRMINDQEENNPAVFKHVLLSAGNTQDPRFIKWLMSYLPDTSIRSIVQKALAKFEPMQILPIMTEVSNDSATQPEILIQLPDLAETMDTQQAIDFLLDMASHPDPAVKRESLEGLHNCKIKFPHLTINVKHITPLLVQDTHQYRETLALCYAVRHYWENPEDDPKIIPTAKELNFLLERRLDMILDRIFWTLGLPHLPDFILPSFKDLRSQDRNSRINTVELLDNMIDNVHKKLVLPIIETALLDHISSETIARLELEIPSQISFFESLLKSQDGVLKLAALNLIDVLDNPAFEHLIQMAIEDDYPSVRVMAEKLLDKE